MAGEGPSAGRRRAPRARAAHAAFVTDADADLLECIWKAAHARARHIEHRLGPRAPRMCVCEGGARHRQSGSCNMIRYKYRRCGVRISARCGARCAAYL